MRQRLRALVDRRLLLSEGGGGSTTQGGERRASLELTAPSQSAAVSCASAADLAAKELRGPSKNLSFASPQGSGSSSKPVIVSPVVAPPVARGPSLSSSASAMAVDAVGGGGGGTALVASGAGVTTAEGGEDSNTDGSGSEAFESLFGDAAPQSLKRGGSEGQAAQADASKPVNRSLHRRGRTGAPPPPPSCLSTCMPRHADPPLACLPAV